jgi:uncharacterized protein involved in exopolysaccharide biosynthesis
MQIQPYTPQNLAAGAADRIQVPGAVGHGPAVPAHQPPSLLQVFGREVWKRKRLLAVWVIVTGIVAAVVVTTIARPLYKAEGRLSYRPNYGAGGPRPIYTPPNIQSAIQILKANDVFEPVRAKHTPNLSADDFAKNVHIDLSKQSEFIDITYEDPNPALAAAVTNDLMAEGLKYFTDVRVQSTRDAVARVSQDLQQAKADLERAKKDYGEAYKAKGIANPDVEMDNLKTALASIGTQLREARREQARLAAEIKWLEEKKKNPDADDRTIDDQFINELNLRLSSLSNKMLDEQAIQTAKFEAERLRVEVRDLRPLMLKGTYPRKEFAELESKLRIQESILKTAEETKDERELLKKQLADFKAKTRNGKRPPRAVVEELAKLQKEQATFPATIEVLQSDERVKTAALNALVYLNAELGPKEEEIRLLRTRTQDLDAQLAAASGGRLDPHANDLRIHSQATTPTAPASTNAPKLALAIVGASALLFIGYISLFGLPRGSFATAGGIAGGSAPAGGLLPRALVALVPYTKKPAGEQAALNANAAEGMTPAPPASTEAADPMSLTPTAAPNMPPLADPAGDAEPVATAEPEPVQALARKIVEEGVDRGGVVLFSPTNEELKVTPAIGDLGQYFSSRGDRVLVFDTRETAESPDWVQANGVAETVAGYLNGTADGSTGCFVPTALRGVEYSRVDLNQKISGVLEVHRFRQLLEQIREKYSVVFLVGPAVTLEADHPLLATMAEGMVLVTETAANPVEVHAYLDTLCQQVPARLYGTLAVPKSAA